MLEWLAGVIGTKPAVIVAGTSGALVSLKFVPEVTTWTSRLSLTVGGSVGAWYIGPGVAEWLSFSNRVEVGLTFALGVIFMSLAGAIVGAIRDAKLSEALTTWFKKPGA